METKELIERLGWHVIAVKKHANGISYDATNYKRLAHGEVRVDSDEAMRSCYEAVLNLRVGRL